MWVLLGSFDGEIVGDSGFQKPKLLKPSHSYTVGRKDRDLLINNKKISHDHCDFLVGSHSVEDVSNPLIKPSLELVNRSKKDKTLLISRHGQELQAYPSSHEPLQEEDVVTLVTGIHVTVKWIPICAYSLSRQFSAQDCASLGIKLVNTPHAEVTHHITTEYTCDLSCSASLLSLCQFVKPEWLQEVIRLGKLPRRNGQSNGVSLEDHFALPQESKHRPAFPPSLLSSLKKISIWEPNEERVNLFQTCRFICLHEKITAFDTELRNVIHRGSGILETFDIHSGIPKFRKALSRSQAKEGKTTVVIGDLDAMQLSVGEEIWNDFLTEARSSKIPLSSISILIQAVMEANVEILFTEVNDDSAMSSRLPEASPNTVSQSSPTTIQQKEAPSRPRLVRRATSLAASREPSAGPTLDVDYQEEQPPAPRKALTRRVLAKPENSNALQMSRKTPPPELIDLTAPTPARPSKLKRRIGVVKETQQTPLSGIEETIREPPLKKFKALFESTNPGSELESSDAMELEGESAGFAVSGETQSQTQTQGQHHRTSRSIGVSSLAVLREEEEETQSNFLSHERGTKRRLASEDDVEMQVANHDSTSDLSEPVRKRMALENVNSVTPVAQGAEQTTAPTTAPTVWTKPTSASVTAKDKATSGAPPGKPDTDVAFLKAIASTKRGKKTEDNFDREFNKLKISKPELDRRDPEEEWGVLADFGDDSGLRGNFMVIVEMDVSHDKLCDASALSERLINRQWDGKPNFKKFKKKTTGYERPRIELIANQDNDYEIENAHWKTQAQSQRRLSESQEEIRGDLQSQSLWQRTGEDQSALAAETQQQEEDEFPRPRRPTSRKPPSRGDSAVPVPSTSRRTTSKVKPAQKTKAKSNPLFLDSDEDQEVEDPAAPSPFDDNNEEETLKSSPEVKRKAAPAKKIKATAAPKTTRKSKKQPVAVVDDDSGDDAVFQGFRGRGKDR